MITELSIPLPFRPTYYTPDVNRLKVDFAWQFYEEGLKKLPERPKVAVKYFNEAVKHAGNKEIASLFAHLIGTELVERGLYQEAELFFQKVLELDAEAYFLWGYALYMLKRYEEAIGKYDKAIDKYREVLELAPNKSLAYLGSGLALHELKKYKEAIERYRKAVEINADSTLAYIAWGLALRELERYDEAIEKYKKAIELDPNLAPASFDLAMLLGVAGQTEEADKEFEKALRLFKEREPKVLEEALACLGKELEAHHNNPSLWRARGKFLEASGKDKEARRSLERAEVYEAQRYFEVHREELLRQYENKFIAILRDKVIDSDEDFEALEEKILKRFGARGIFVDRVTKEPEIIYMPTPFSVS